MNVFKKSDTLIIECLERERNIASSFQGDIVRREEVKSLNLLIDKLKSEVGKVDKIYNPTAKYKPLL